MKQETKLIVESTDLPTYEPGFTDQGYLSLNTHTKIVVPNQNVEFLDHLIAAATALAASIRKTQEPVTQPAELQHPGTWLPGDQVQEPDKTIWTRDNEGKWRYRGSQVGFLRDRNVDLFLAPGHRSKMRIVRLAERSAS